MENFDVDVVQVMPPKQLTISEVAGYYYAYSEPIKVDDYLGVELIVSYGDVSTSGAVQFMVQYSDEQAGGFASVANDELLGLESIVGIPAAASRTSGVDQNISRRIGYRATRPWVRVGFKAKAPATFVVSVDAMLLRVPRG